MPALENLVRHQKEVPTILLVNRGIDETTAAELSDNSGTLEGRLAIVALPEVDLDPQDLI